jgi:hypothetical protein
VRRVNVPLYAGRTSSAYCRCLRGSRFIWLYGSIVEGGSLMSEMSSLAVWRGVRPRGVGRRYLHAGIRVSRRSQTKCYKGEKGRVPESGKLGSGWDRTLSINAVEVGNVDGSRIN